MKRLLIASALTLAVVAPAMAQIPAVSGPSETPQILAEVETLAAPLKPYQVKPTDPKSYPCVIIGPGNADCTEASRAIAADRAAELPPPQGIPVQSPTLQGELVSLRGVMIQMLIQQTETNRLLAEIAPPRVSK